MNNCQCCKKDIPIKGPRLCPECGHKFAGTGWVGIDAHWRKHHESVMSYEAFRDSLCEAHHGPGFVGIQHEKQYLDFIKKQGVGKRDKIASSPLSYRSYLRTVSKYIGMGIGPAVLSTERDVESLAQRIISKVDPTTISKCRTAMRHYVMMIQKISSDTTNTGGRAWSVQRKPHHHDRISEFLAQGIVAIGWPEDSFNGISKEKLQKFLKAYNKTNTKAVITKKLNAIWAFINEMSSDDLVLVPEGDHVYIGRIASDYYYDTTKATDETGYANQRRIKWLRREPYPKKIFPEILRNALLSRFPPVAQLPLSAAEIFQCLKVVELKGERLPQNVHERSLGGRPIGFKDEANYIAFRKKAEVQVERIHNALINAFNQFIRETDGVDESDYDILIRNGLQPDRALLIEAKSKVNGGSGRQQIREAIGQLFDYQFMLSQDGLKKIDLALLVPDEPEEDLKKLVHERLGIEIIWKAGKDFHGTKKIEHWLANLRK